MRKLLLLLLLIIAMPVIGRLAIPVTTGIVQDDVKASIERGKEVYTLNCLSCHQVNGEGLSGVYPPLAKSNHLTKDQGKSITIILTGQHEEINVNGVKYNIPMAAMNYLTDQQIADVLNYIGKSWGNEFNTVTPSQVKAKRN